MARKTYEELKKIMEQENCSRIWSWSKFNCFKTSPFEYYLKYIKHAEEDRQDCIYTSTGSLAHDIIEKFYTGKIKHEDMIGEFEDGWITLHDIAQLKFDRNNEEKNKSIGEKYYLDLQHFFNNHTTLKYNPALEQFVKVKIGSHLFHGYIDCCFKDDDGNYNIIDWKTSTVYKGDKAKKECGQLVTYALALNEMGVPMDKIKIAWNFLKYCTVQYTQANLEVKTREIERFELGEKLQANLKVWLKKLGYKDKMDEYLKMVIDTNSIECLPEDVQAKYKISDCYIYVDLTDDLINSWKDDIITTIKDIALREKDWEEIHSENVWWDTDESVKAQSYYFSTLCGYSGNLHKPYGEYLKKLEAAKNNTDLFGGLLGSNSSASSSKVIENSTNDIDLSWLENL
jgi:hypothetical protein